jgi:hypothetical protein
VRVIEELKHDEPSWLLSIRLDRFIGRYALFDSVIKISSALLFVCSEKLWRSCYCLISIFFLITTLGYSCSRAANAKEETL